MSAQKAVGFEHGAFPPGGLIEKSVTHVPGGEYHYGELQLPGPLQEVLTITEHAVLRPVEMNPGWRILGEVFDLERTLPSGVKECRVEEHHQV